MQRRSFAVVVKRFRSCGQVLFRHIIPNSNARSGLFFQMSDVKKRYLQSYCHMRTGGNIRIPRCLSHVSEHGLL